MNTPQLVHIFHFFMESLILAYYLFHIIPVSKPGFSRLAAGVLFIFPTIILYSENLWISGTLLRLLFRSSCYVFCIRFIHKLPWKTCIYYTLICMILFTANTNIWQTPYLYPVSRCILSLHPDTYLNIIFCSLLEYSFCFFVFFLVTHAIHLNSIAEIHYHRFTVASVIIICELFVKSSLKAINDAKQSTLSEMSFYAIFLHAALIALLVIYERYLYSRRLQEVHHLQELSSRYQFKTLQMKERNEQDIRRLHHDMKNHLLAIRNYYHSGSISQADDYIDSIMEKFIPYESGIETGHPMLNGLLTQKQNEAVARQIEISILLDGRPISYISDIDLCTIFGNILDNAIEACCQIPDPRKRFITVKGGEVNHQFFLCVTNSFSGTLKIINGLPITSKANKKFHGFGLNHVKEIINNYNGSLTFDTSAEEVFKLKILLPLTAWHQ